MADPNTVIEGKIKLREGRRWHPRWCVLKKLSPVADQLQIHLFKDLVEVVAPERKPTSVIILDTFFGLDSGFTYGKEINVMAIISERKTTLMAFELLENMIDFEIKIRESLGAEYQFPVTAVKTSSKKPISKKVDRVILHGKRFCLASQKPPKVTHSWNIENVSRYGAVGEQFCFEVGADSGKESGVFILESVHSAEIVDIVDSAVTGKLANCHRKVKSRRRPSPPTSQDVTNEHNYTVQTIQIENEGGLPHDADSHIFSTFQVIAGIDNNRQYECVHPAKSVLRPRSGQEYVLVHRRSIQTPVNSACLSRNSPFVNRMFNFDFHSASEIHHHHHSTQSPHPLPNLSHLPHRSRSLSNTPQPSPSASSTAETVKSYCSTFTGYGREGQLSARSTVTDTLSVNSSPKPGFSLPLFALASPSKSIHQSSARINTEESVFFPKALSYITFPLSQCPSQPAQISPTQQTPDYVNQEFVNKHHRESCGSQTVSTGSNHSSASPTQSVKRSLMSFISKDSTNTLSSSEFKTVGGAHTKNRTISRDLECDAKISGVQRSHSDPKKSGKDEALQLKLPSEGLSSVQSKTYQKEYDKFVNSIIISRRRKKYAELNPNCNAETKVISGSGSIPLKDTGLLNIPALKSSGYKNIDCFNSATFAAVKTPSPRSLSAGPGTSYPGRISQLDNIWESHISPRDQAYSSNKCSDFSETCSLNSPSVFESSSQRSLSSSAPPLPQRNRLNSSPLPSPLSSTPTPLDVSDSPPPYFAPSPPSTPPLPALPPRQSLIPPPIFLPPSTPSEVEATSSFSEEEAELNYIEIDMTKSPSETIPPPRQLSFSHRSKRIRQQKKDYAKLRYAEIDHRATKALQEARQEHVQGRDSSIR